MNLLHFFLSAILLLLKCFVNFANNAPLAKANLVRKIPFMWGTATAAYQIEGAVHMDGRGDSIWDTFSHIKNKIHNNDNGDIADDSYNQFMKDIQLMKDMGMNSYRFSISWSRILPEGYGEINYVGINHYNRLIDELIKNDIEPLVSSIKNPCIKALYLIWIILPVYYLYLGYFVPLGFTRKS